MVDSWLSLLQINYRSWSDPSPRGHNSYTISIPLSNPAQRRTYAHDSDDAAENQNCDDIDDKDTGVTSCRWNPWLMARAISGWWCRGETRFAMKSWISGNCHMKSEAIGSFLWYTVSKYSGEMCNISSNTSSTTFGRPKTSCWGRALIWPVSSPKVSAQVAVYQ